MKTTVTIVNGDIKIAFEPDSEIERLVIRELGDEISVSHTHQSLVLRRRGQSVKSFNSVEPVEDDKREGTSVSANAN